MAKESEVLGSVQATLTDANAAALLQHAALPDLNKAEIARYSRHLIMPEVGMAGQRKLKAASVLLIGVRRPGLAAWIIPDGGRCGTDWSGGFRRGRLQQPMGGRSADAYRMLQQAGFKWVKNLKGGITAWADQVDHTVPKY